MPQLGQPRSEFMSSRPETSSAVSTEHIEGDALPDQQRSHGSSEGPATGETQIAPISTTFTTPYNAGTVTNVNGNINNIYYENSDGAPAYVPPLLVSDIHLDHAVTARFDCKDRTPCTERTRIDVIGRIDTWSNNGPPVFWLNGSAGTGKSTIAFTVAKSFKRRGILGASFFCSRDDATCSNHKLIFPTIAHQLAQFHPEYRRCLADVVKKRPDIVHSDVAYQLQELIVKPLGSMHEFPACVVVIDALDECKDDSTISVILAAFSRHVEKLAPLKIFLTSRPERNINLGFSDSVLQGATHRFILHEIHLSTVEADIKTHIIAQLEIVRREYRIDQSWPFEGEVDSLSTLSCGLFIFAATAIKFIQDRNYDDPQGQLTRVISNAMPLKDEVSDPLHRLDQLYLQVLMNAHPKPSAELAGRLSLLIGTIVLLQDPLSFHGIQELLRHELAKCFEAQSMRQTLARLHSIILVPDNDKNMIRTLHPSFFDFITNPNRCSISRLLVDTGQQHTLLLGACLRTMKGLKRNVCELPDPSVLNNEVADLPSCIAKYISPELQYACRHWGTHLQHADISANMWVLLSWFCSEQMLFWVEACSLLGDLRNQLVLLDAVQRTLAGSAVATAAMTLLHDCERFIREFFPVISTAWAHVYDSTLTFAPQKSALRKCYSSQIKVVGGPKKWDVCSRIIEGHSGGVLSVVYSPDGTRIASGTHDGTIQFWDAVSGAHLNTLEGHFSSVNSVAFSPDGARIVSGSSDGSICLWDAISGKLWKTLTDNSTSILAVAYSPDGTRIASASLLTLQLWDSISGACLNTLSGNFGSIHSVAFSPDGARITYGSALQSICLWDFVNGTHLDTPRHSHDVRSVAYSPDGTLIASGSADYTICIWDAVKWKHRKTLKGHRGTVLSVAFSPDPDGTVIASASEDKTIRLWDVVSEKQLATLEGHSGCVISVSFSPDGTRILSGSDDQTIRLWITGHRIHPKRDPKQTSSFLPAFSGFKIARSLAKRDHISNTSSLLVSFSPDSSVIVSVPLHGPPALWDAVSGAHLRTLKGNSNRVNTVAVSHDGTRIVCGSFESVRMWNTVSGVTEKMTLERPGSPVCVTFSHDDFRIAAGCEDGTIRVWDVLRRGRPHAMTLEGHRRRVVSVQFSPQYTCMASGSEDGTIRLWEPDTRLRWRSSMTFHMELLLRSIAFSPDGNHLIVAVTDDGESDNNSLIVAVTDDGESDNEESDNEKSGDEEWRLELLDFFCGREVLKSIRSHQASPALWLPFSPEHRDLATDDNATRQCAQASGPTQKYHYFLQDGWVWLAHPRRRLCWVPVACRGPDFSSSNARIAFRTQDLRIVIIDFSDIFDSLPPQA